MLARRILTAALGGIAAISLTVAGVGIMNVMLVSVSERTREIGLLKALGVTRVQVLVVFLVEASILSTAGGALGPLFGVWLSLVAIDLAPIGIATTLMALPPVFLLPIGRFVFGERITAHAIFGTFVALAGVALLFLLA